MSGWNPPGVTDKMIDDAMNGPEPRCPECGSVDLSVENLGHVGENVALCFGCGWTAMVPRDEEYGA